MAFRSIERALRIPVFFAKPYCSTDKPHVELLNKLIRQYIPKGTSFKDIDDKQIRNIRMLLNNRPRKSLDFKSPNEVLALLLSYRCTWYWNLQGALLSNRFSPRSSMASPNSSIKLSVSEVGSDEERACFAFSFRPIWLSYLIPYSTLSSILIYIYMRGLKGWREACGTNKVQKWAKERLRMMPNEEKGQKERRP